MPIQLNLTDGTPLGLIQDQTLNSSLASVTFIGKGWIGGGADVWNQNLLQMLENFAGFDYPNHPLIGQIWYDANRQGIRVQVGVGGPDGDANGWTSVLTTLDYVNQGFNSLSNAINNLGYTTNATALVFDNPSSDIVVPARGTIANPPALILKTVNTGWPAGDAAGDPAGTPAVYSGSTYTNIIVNNKGLVLGARALAAHDLATAGGTSAIKIIGGDVTGSGAITANIALTLVNVNNSVGTFNNVIVNAKGLVIGAFNETYSSEIEVTGDVFGNSIGNTLTLTLETVNNDIGTFNTVVVNAKGLVTSASNVSGTNGMSNAQSFICSSNTTSTVSYWTCPPNVYLAKITVVGGGGGGAGCSSNASAYLGSVSYGGGGGGAGGAVQAYVPVIPGTVYTVVSGFGGLGGTSTSTNTPPLGANGGTSSFGNSVTNFLTAYGGLGGGDGVTYGNPGGLGGNTSVSISDVIFNTNGGDGGAGNPYNIQYGGGHGGASFFGGGGAANVFNGNNAEAFGSGGGGAFGQTEG